jgi:hypothetical protein
MKISFYLKIMWIVFVYNLLLLKRNIINKYINLIIWIFITLFIGCYVLTNIGVSNQFNILLCCGLIATIGFFEAYRAVPSFISDLENKQMIYFELSFPLPVYLMFLSKILAFLIVFILLTLMIIPICLLLVKNIIVIKTINWNFLCVAIFFSNFFYAVLVFFISSFIKNMDRIGDAWSRFIFPMWHFGGYHFAWRHLYEANRYIAYINLLNPIIYINEAFKIAITNQPGILSFYGCIGMIICFTILCFLIFYNKLKKRLNFI